MGWKPSPKFSPGGGGGGANLDIRPLPLLGDAKPTCSFLAQKWVHGNTYQL